MAARSVARFAASIRIRARRLRRSRPALLRVAGYTLTELLVVMVVLGVVLAATTGLFVSAVWGEVGMNRRFQAQQQARLGLERIRREAHCASDVTPQNVTTSSVTLTLPAGCPLGSGAVTWCTRSMAAGRFGLYRVVGAACAGGTLVAESLTVANAFTYTPGLSPVLGTLRVDLTTDVDPSSARESYELVDSIVLRNDAR